MQHAIVRRAIVSIVTLGTVLLGIAHAPVASAGDRYARRLLAIVNATRERHDLRPLKLERSLDAPARRHSSRMLRANRLFDPPNLDRILAPYRWNDLGADVVGCGPTLREMQRTLMTDAFHRTILLHTRVRRIGIGVVATRDRNRCGRGSVWATEILYG
jgi:uncharacterized protein YkwD